jgi:hypothetical protein
VNLNEEKRNLNCYVQSPMMGAFVAGRIRIDT